MPQGVVWDFTSGALEKRTRRSNYVIQFSCYRCGAKHEWVVIGWILKRPQSLELEPSATVI